MSDKIKTDYREIFDTLTDGLIILDNSYIIKELNQSAELLLNTSRNKLLGKNLEAVFPGEILDLLRKADMEERSISDDDLLVSLAPDNVLSLQTTVIPVIKNNGSREGFILQIRDIEGTKLLSAKNNFEKFNSNIEGLVLALLHELKNPLSGIRGAAQLLGPSLSEGELSRCSEIIVSEADRLTGLIDRIKRLEDVDIDSFSPVDINEILMDIIFLQSRAEDGRIRFTNELDISIPPVSGDPDSLKQVFINIITNAVQSIEDQGEIKVKTRLINDYKIKSSYPVLISVKDTGVGIPRELCENIFAPFYTTKKYGSGIGLFLSYHIVVKHGGIISVESEEGRGSEFRIFLPAKN